MPPFPPPRLVRSHDGTPPTGTRLADFIASSIEPILAEWEAFARTQSSAMRPMDVAELRDHAAEILAVIAADLRRPQTSRQQTAKSKGLAPAPEHVSLTAAQVHAVLRARSGFDVNQMTSEYRALRASVLRLWFAAAPELRHDDIDDLMRFNEAIDQSLAESLRYFSEEVDRARVLFLGVLGHDLRNPLNAISLSSALLTARPQDDPRIVAGRIADGCMRMQRLLDDLVDYTRGSMGMAMPVTPGAMDLQAAVRAELDALQVVHPARTLRLTATGRTLGHWDGLRLRQAVGNLVANALQHGAVDASVDVAIDGTEEHEVALSVANEGEPIAPELAEQIFEPLTQGRSPASKADGAHHHLGLGLHIARQIVQAHKGSITLTNPPGERIVFTITLPRGTA